MKTLLLPTGVILIVAIGVALAASPAQAWVITTTGTVYSDGHGTPDQTGLFGTPGQSMEGLAYTQTITTDPLLSAFSTDPNPIYQEYNGGPGLPSPNGCCGAPYTIATTVNGVTYTQTESNPYINRSYLFSGLGTGLALSNLALPKIRSISKWTRLGVPVDTVPVPTRSYLHMASALRLC